MKKPLLIAIIFSVTVLKLYGQTAPVVGTITQPTCSTATGSVVLSGLPDTGTWTLTMYPGGSTSQGTGTSTTVTGLATGTFTFTVTNESGGTSPASNPVVIDAQPGAPSSAAVTITQPTCAVTTGTIIVTAPTGAYEYNLDGGTYQSAVTFSGVAAGSHTILVRRSTDNTCISSPTSATINAQPTAPSAATVTITQPTCSVSTGTILVTAPTGAYEYNLDGGTYQSAVTFSEVAEGSHTILVRRSTDNTCISSPTSATVNAQPAAPSSATINITQPTCSVATGTIRVTAPLGAYEYNLDGGSYQSGVTFSGVTAGSHTILVRRSNDNTCISAPISATVNAQPSTPSAPGVGTIAQPTCAVSTGSVILNGLPAGNWVINPGNIAGSTSSTTISGLSAGTYNYTVTNSQGCTSPTSANIVINAQPTAPSAATINITQPTCAVATGTIVVTSPAGAYEYNLDGGTYQSAVTFPGVATGSHTILVRRSTDNTCISSPTSATINAQPTAPSAATVTITQPTCAISTGTIVVTAPAGAFEYNLDGGTYQSAVTFSGVAAGSHTILVRRSTDNTCISSPTSAAINAPPTAPSSATITITQPTCAVATGTIVITAPIGAYEYNMDGGTYQSVTTFPGLAAGSHTVLVRRSTDNTCISSPTSAAINAPPTAPSSATVTITQPTCAVATGTIVVTAPAGAYEYNLDGGTYQSAATFPGVTAGAHTILVRRSTDITCISSPTSATVNAQPTAPSAATVTITQPTCAVATGTIVVTAPTGAYEYNLDGGTYQSAITFSGLAAGSHTVLVRRSTDNTCISSPTSATINTPPTAPSSATVTITQPTCAVATGTIVVTAPTGAYEYNLDGGTYQAAATFSGVAAGSHSIRVRRSTDNTCISSPTSATVNAQPTAPSAATVTITQPTCAVATGTIVVTAPAGAYEYNLDGGTYQSAATFPGVTAGAHTILVRRSNDITCISSPTSATVNAQPTAPSAATVTITQPTCAVATGTIVVTAPAGAYEYNLDGGTYQSAVTFSGLTAGSHTILVRRSTDNTCISSPTSAAINAPPTAPSSATVTITQPTCAVATGTIVVTAPIGAYEYNMDGGTYQSAATFSGVAAGSHSIRVRRSTDNTCISSPTSATINVQPTTPSAPTAGTITQPTCAVATGSVILNGLPSGSWTINPGNRTGSTTSTTISGLTAGTYNFTVTNADGCTSTGSANITINQQPPTPVAPTIVDITQPTCNISTGSVSLAGLPSSGSWTITRSPGGSTTNGSGTSTTISGLPASTYHFTVTNSSGCVSTTSDDAVINVQPSTPSAPSIGTRTQPTCTVATGSVVLNGLPASGTWAITRTPGDVTNSGTGTSTTVTGLAGNTYTFTVTNASGCTSASSNNVVINAQPPTPSAPVIGTVTQPTFSVPTGSVVLTGLPSSGSWTLARNPGDNTITGSGTGTTIAGLAAGSYTFTVTNSSGCISATSSTVVLNIMKLSDSEGKILRPNDTIKIDNTEAGSLSISVESNTDWSVSENSLWFQAVKESATSTIRVNYLENISVLDKAAPLSVSYALNPDFVINIKQKARVSQLRVSKLDQVKMYPNPANNVVYLNLGKEDFDKIKTSITSIQGYILTTKEFDNLPASQIIELDISGLPVGQYLIRITDGNSYRVFLMVKL